MLLTRYACNALLNRPDCAQVQQGGSQAMFNHLEKSFLRQQWSSESVICSPIHLTTLATSSESFLGFLSMFTLAP